MRIATLLLSAWLGASALFAAVVAPSAFAVLPSRSLAGALVGRVLPVLFTSGLALAIAVLLLDRPAEGRYFLARRAALFAVAVSCAVAQFIVAPRIARVRAEIAGPVEQLPADDPRRLTFGRLHAVSVGWLGVAMAAAGLVVVLGSLPPKTRRPVDAESMAAGLPRRA